MNSGRCEICGAPCVLFSRGKAGWEYRKTCSAECHSESMRRKVMRRVAEKEAEAEQKLGALPKPTDAMPGTQKKVEEMRERESRHESLFSPEDETDWHGQVGCEEVLIRCR